MASLTYKLTKLAEKRALGKRAIVKVNGVPYDFVLVRWGGTSPVIVLSLGGIPRAMTAAEWKRNGAALP